jgi:hypothetical protein
MHEYRHKCIGTCGDNPEEGGKNCRIIRRPKKEAYMGCTEITGTVVTVTDGVYPGDAPLK